MMFWGIEVKSGETAVVQPGKDMLLHLSQACLGEIKKDKGSEYVRLYAKKDGQKFLLGILSPEKFPHLNFDVVFEDDFELFHNSKHGSVHFAGYKAPNPDVEENESDESDDEPVPVQTLDDGRSNITEERSAASKMIAAAKPETTAGKAMVKIVEPNKDAKQNEKDDHSDGDDEDDSEDSEEDEDEEGESSDDEDESSDEDDESDEETPKKAEASKKRAAEGSNKTGGPDKKAKFATPNKNDGKKPVPHVATPHPAKQAGKIAANSDKSKQQTPKSSGSFPCNSCNRSFGSEQALQSHSNAKHGAK